MRRAGFGYGTKYDFTAGKFKTPAPNNYAIRSEIDLKKEKKFGSTFGESRGKMTNGGIFEKHLLAFPGYKSSNKLISKPREL